MKGNNELRINEATMMEAVQLWLDSKFKENPPTVKAVEQSSDPGGYSKVFQVKLSSEKEADT